MSNELIMTYALCALFIATVATIGLMLLVSIRIQEQKNAKTQKDFDDFIKESIRKDIDARKARAQEREYKRNMEYQTRYVDGKKIVSDLAVENQVNKKGL